MSSSDTTYYKDGSSIGAQTIYLILFAQVRTTMIRSSCADTIGEVYCNISLYRGDPSGYLKVLGLSVIAPSRSDQNLRMTAPEMKLQLVRV